MRENYRWVRDSTDLPPNAAAIRIWSEAGRTLASVDLGDGDVTLPGDPDLALFAASLALQQYGLSGLYVWLEDRALWQDDWGNLLPLDEPAAGDFIDLDLAA